MAIGMTNATSSAIKTILNVSVTDSSSSGYQSGRSVTVTNGTDTQTKTTDSSGNVSFKLKGIGDYTVTTDVPSGGRANTATVTAELGGVYTASLTISFGWGTFGMTFNATTFTSDPTGCLTYTDDCSSYTPVSGPGSSLAKCSTIGSWVMNADGTSSNKLLAECFYATFTSAGVLHEKLNPQDLTKKIATWDNTNKVWVSASGTSSITTEDTMFCIPTTYISSTSSKIQISGNASDGTAFAHTIDGHVYKYLAIGVYPANLTSGVLYSKSGAASTVSTTRPSFRSAATSKTVQNGKAMLWNPYQWNLWRIMTIFAMKSFNGQTRIGQGGYSYGAENGGTLMNAMGPFAGSSSTSTGTSTGVKAFIENPWGHNYEFIDDFICVTAGSGSHTIYTGRNSSPDDTTSNKSSFTSTAVTGYANVINTNAEFWGFPMNGGGNTTTGLCDRIYHSTSSGTYLGLAGGSSARVSSGDAGPSCLGAAYSLSLSSGDRGARLAFVFDL